MKKYSVLTYNLGGYEIIHEIPKEAINPEIEYIYVTDDHNIKSDTWTIVYVDDLTGSVFDKCYQIRFFPFKYVNTDIVMRVDGSMSITNDVMWLFDSFEKFGYDAAVMIHPGRNTMVPEYAAWCNIRGYSPDQAMKCLNFLFGKLQYDVNNYKGLYQGNFTIQRNDNFNNAWNLETYDILKHLATEPDTIERIDQTIWSAILNINYQYKNIMPISNLITNGQFFNWYVHGTETRMMSSVIPQQYLFNKEVKPIDYDL